MIKVTITRYRKGQLSVPLLYTDVIDTLAENMSIRRAGTEIIRVLATRISMYQNVQLVTDMQLNDVSNTVLIAGDNSGHIDQLARIDCAVKLVDDGNAVSIIPAIALLSGGSAQTDGTVDSVVSETLVFALGGMYPYQLANQLSRIAKFRIDIDTPNNTTYVTSCEVFRVDRDSPTEYSAQAFTDDIGNGTTGHAYGERTITSPFTGSSNWLLKITTVRTAGTLTITQIRLYLDMDT